MLRLLLARHGQSEGDTQALIEGSADLPLTVTGRLQGRLLAERILREYREREAPAAVFTSPLLRASDIAGDLASRLDVPVFVDDRLAELSTGIMAGVSLVEAAKRWPLPERGHLLFERNPGGESDIDQYARVLEFTLNLMDVLGEPFPGVWGRRPARFEGECESTQDLAPWEGDLRVAPSRRVLGLLGHGGTVGKLLRVLTGLPLNAPVYFPHGDTGLSEVLIEDSRVRVIRMNCQRHLPPILREPGVHDVAAEDPEGVAAAVSRWSEAAGAL